MLKRISNYIIYILLALSGLIVLLLGSFSFLWSNIGSYQRPIQTFLMKQIGFKLDFKTINGKIDFNFEPDITVTGLKIIDIKTQTPIITIDKLFAQLSIASLLELKPIFSHLEINGSNINLELDKNNNILLNQYILTNLDDKESNSIDYEKLLLLQKNIDVKNINIKLIDSKHHLSPIEINKLNLHLKNYRLLHMHNLNVRFMYNNVVQVHTFLTQRGNKLSDFDQWKNAEFSLSTTDESGHTVLANAKVTNYQLDYFNLNFNTSTQNIQQLTDNIHGNTVLSGMLTISQNPKLGYIIKGERLNINTVAGNILNNATISGKYKDHKGNIQLNQINLNGISSIKLLNIYDKYKISGTIKNINYQFDGNIFNHDHFSLSAFLNNFTANSLLKDYPSINNLSANIRLTDNNAQITTRLNKSEINYSKYLKNPVLIDDALFNINITSPNNKYLSQIDIESGYITNNNINMALKSTINLNKNNMHLDARIKQFNFNNLYKYLPLSLGESTIKNIQHNILSGNLNNIHLIINAPFDKLPESGVVLTADIKSLVYKIDNKIPPLKNINAKFSLINDNLLINGDGFEIKDYRFNKFNLMINKLYNNQALLTLSLLGSGPTQSLIDLIINSKYQDYLANIPVLNVIGDNKINLELKTPLYNFNKFKLNASLTLLDNKIEFANQYPSINNINGSVNINQDGIKASEINANLLQSPLNLVLHDNKNITLTSESFNYSGLYKYLTHESAKNIFDGYSDLKISGDIYDRKFSFYSSLNGLIINAPVPFGKFVHEIKKPLTLNYEYGKLHDDSLIRINYTDSMKGDIILDTNLNPQMIKLAIGNAVLPNTINKYYIKANVSETRVVEWINFVKQLTHNLNLSDDITNDDKRTKPFLGGKLFFDWTTKSVWIDNYNIDGGNIKGIISDSIISLNLDFPDIYGNIDYYIDNNFTNINLNKLIINTNNLVGIGIIESGIVDYNKNAQFAQENKNQFVAKRSSTRKEDRNQVSSNDIESRFFNESQLYVDNRDVNSPKINIPDIRIFIKNMYFENHYLGVLQANLVQRNNNLYIESASITNQTSNTIFRVIEHNINPDGSKIHYTDLRLQSNIKNLGKLFTKLNLGDNLNGGNGLFDLTLNWGGGIKDFNLYRNKGKISLNVKNGTFTEIKPGLFGSLFGVVSLTSITHANQLNMNTFFGKGLVFEEWTTNIDLIYDRLNILNLTLMSPSTTIKSFGSVDIKNMIIDSYLTIEPRLSTTVATTAGIVTLNPIIGIFVYIGSAIFGNPVNKLLAISYHITGTVENPKMQSVNLNDQIQHNFSSSADITQISKDTTN